MSKVIKRSGWPYCDAFNYHGFRPEEFVWQQGDCGASDVTVYLDHDHMGGLDINKGGLRFLLDNFNNNRDRLRFLARGFKNNRDRLQFLTRKREKNSDRLQFLWLSESRAIEGRVQNHVLENADLFFDTYDAIFVHDRELIEKDKRFKYLPNGSNKHWIADCGIHKKTKLVSMINSGKRMCKGHVLRNTVSSKIRDRVDLYGLLYHRIDRKEEGLNDYMFSIALENARYKTYYTEKILDCFATGTIPVYWGAPDICDYFNEDGIIQWSDDFDVGLLNEDLYYAKMDAIKENFDRCMNIRLSEDLLYEEMIKCGL